MDPTGLTKMETSDDAEPSVADVAGLIDNLKNVDVEVRMRSVKQVGVIAATLGAPRTRDELLPFLQDTIDDEEQVQIILAEALKSFVPLVGGPEHAHALAPILETLSSVEDAAVREKAVESINAVVAESGADSITHFVAMFRRLADARWFTMRTAAAAIFTALYRRASANVQTEILKRYCQLGEDETPMVRRAVASVLKDIATCATDAAVELSLMRLLRDFSEDDQDSVRLLAAGACPPLASRCAAKGGLAPIGLIFQRIVQDVSWRVRYMAAENITPFTEIVAQDPTHLHLVAMFSSLLSDGEAEVRSVAASKVFLFCNALPPATRAAAVPKDIMPRLSELARDPSEHVRTALAAVIMALSSLVGKDLTIAQLLPLFLHFLKDECSDVRLNIISHLEDVNRVIGIGQLSQALLPAIQELATHRQWRVRLAIVENIPLVAKQLGPEFFNTNLLMLCVQWLQDAIYAVRRAATDNVRTIAATYGPEWVKKQLMPLILQLTSSETFVHRLTAVFALNSLLEMCDKETLRTIVLTALIRLAHDKIPNIRLNVVQTLFNLSALIERPSVDSMVQPILVELNRDTDRDVHFGAMCALQDLGLAR